MEATLLNSLMGALVFTLIMVCGYKYASGKWIVADSKKLNYLNWVSNYGKKLKKMIIVISIIYGVFMLFQILSSI